MREDLVFVGDLHGYLFFAVSSAYKRDMRTDILCMRPFYGQITPLASTVDLGNVELVMLSKHRGVFSL